MKQTTTCTVRTANGQPCGQPAALFNADYTDVVCLRHATHLSEEQWGLLQQVLVSLGGALGQQLIAGASPQGVSHRS